MPLQYKLIGSLAMACAEVNFTAGTCDIYHMENTLKSVMWHEEAHCRGEDHDGILQAYFDKHL